MKPLIVLAILMLCVQTFAGEVLTVVCEKKGKCHGEIDVEYKHWKHLYGNAKASLARYQAANQLTVEYHGLNDDNTSANGFEVFTAAVCKGKKFSLNKVSDIWILGPYVNIGIRLLSVKVTKDQ